MPYEETQRDLEEMVALLEADGWDHWANFFRRALSLLHSGNIVDCGTHILSGSGGMGSLNDIVLGQGKNADGQFEWKPGYEEQNKRYSALLTSLYEFSDHARRSARES